jgi:hypothetical protein
MRSLVSLLLVASLGAGCAVRATSHDRWPAATREGSASLDTGTLRAFVERLPVGSIVALDLRSGERFKGVLLGVHNDDVILQPTGRSPEPERRVPLSEVVRLQPGADGGLSAREAIGLGIGIGAVSFLVVLLSAFAIS